jgi:concentrative nucleoside transporter, CNT family
MQKPESLETPVEPTDAPPPVVFYPPTPLSWRLAILAGIVAIGGTAFLIRDTIGLRGQSLVGIVFFFGLVAAFSANLRAVNWRTIGWGIALQVLLAVAVLKVGFVYKGFEIAGDVVNQFVSFSSQGAKFVFGNLADPRPPQFGGTWSPLFPGKVGEKNLFPGQVPGESNWWFQFAFIALPPILFVSAFFTVLYHFGILQLVVRAFARIMLYLMGTSGAETLSVAANVFMGQTEAPLIIRPYIPRMTNSELFVLMASGMAHISGALMAVYISYGANPVAVISTCVMACPCSLYLSKLFLPEVSKPETSGMVRKEGLKSPYVNAIDAAATGTSDGLGLALNVAAMLIVFIAFVAMFNGLLALIDTATLSSWTGWSLPDHITLQWLFGKLFSPVAFLMGVAYKDIEHVGTLLGIKLAINEHVAFLTMRDMMTSPDLMSKRSYRLAAFALTGFANFSSVGIQLGGIGALAPSRRHDLARLGLRALFVGFTASLLNAAVAGIMLPEVLTD